MSDPTLQLEWKGDVAIVRLNDPTTLNAITLGNIAAFAEALDAVEARARAMIVTGAGRAFCSGANLSGGMGDDVAPEEFDAGSALETHINPLMQRLHDLRLPWITAVRGAAAGAGASLALAGDMIVASETAYFLQAFARIGLVPDAGSSHLLVRTIGRPRAMELMLLGEKLPAQTALAWGLINRIVPDDKLEADALALAQRLAAGPASLRAIRQVAWRAVDADWQEALSAERSLQLGAGRSADYREGVAAFQGKRAARFVGA
ncbi:enoyl-CoA hydratase-related protein [uncultured Sphingomonas sp.]|uniref:enoyl-CoA hydratase-related protein n=1 Tax=uncultured Sphingomonas sp. TaxID=158754 RepID=UPI0035CB20A3